MKKIYAFLLMLAMMPAIFAQVDDWDGSAVQWTHGSGTEADPYLIESAENLAWIAEMVNNGVTTYTGVHFLMTTDLNLKNLQWSPIGNSANNSFQGNFDGGAHFIDSLYMNSSTLVYGGLFGYIKDATVQRVGVNAKVTRTSASSTPYFGGICGYATGTTTISHCSNTGSVSSSSSSSNSSYSGGICGYATGTTTVSHCSNTGSVSSSSSNSSTNSNSNSYSGGICGLGGTTVSHCSNTGSVSSSSSSSNSSSNSNSYSGGICGYYAVTNTVSHCSNTGSVSSYSSNSSNSSNSHSYSGGICGNLGQCTNCYNLGTVKSTSSNSSTAKRAAGIGVASTCRNCYNVGTLSATNVYGCSDGTATNCYYLETCGATTGGTPKTEQAMKSASFPIMLNADSTVFAIDVTPNVNQGYPIFATGFVYSNTEEADNIQFTSATLHGNYYAEYADVVGFEYKPTAAARYTKVYANIGTPASYALTGLESGTSYDFRMFVEKDGVTYYGNTLSFSTLQCDIAANINAVSTSICAGDTATLTAESTSSLSDEFTYSWSNGSSNPSIEVAEAGTYTVTVTDGNGCTATVNTTIVVNPLPNGNITGNLALCSGQSTTLTGSGANRYNWSTGASAPTITVNESGTYTCTFSNSYNCTSTKSVEVTVFDSPVILGNASFCTGGSTTLTATGGSNYTWSTGETTPSITVSNAGTYSVTGTSTGGCSGSSSITVVENELPNVAITGTTTICSGIGTQLTATESSSYLWSTGAETRAINVNAPGNYSVLITDENGCSNTTSVEVASLSNISISGNTSICQGENATLSVDLEGNYLWSNGAQTSFITVNNAGNYSVTVSLPNGCSTSASTNVVVNALPVPTISGNTNICQGETTTLTANGGVSYRWSNSATSASISVGTAGLYSVTATNAMGCVGSTYATVTVNALPTVTISGNNSTCEGSTTTLTANGAQNYQWSNGSTNATITVGAAGQFTVTGYSAQGCSNTASTSVVVYPTYNTPISHSMCQGESYNFFGQNLTATGTYTHTLYSNHGCDSVITLTLTVKELPVVNITGNTTFCEGNSSVLYANGGTSYQWNNGMTGNSLLVSEAGTYTVTATNAQGCSNVASTYVTVNPLPSVTISGNTSTCQGNNVTLIANGAQSYQWNNGSTNATLTVGATGQFTVTGYSAQGCSNTASTSVVVYPTYNTPISHSMCQGESYNFFGQNLTAAGTYTHTLFSAHGCDSVITLTLTVKELPNVNITGNTSICQGENTTLVVNGGVSYQWSNGSQSSSISVSETGAYTVTATNVEGCSASATAYVTVNPLPSVSISGNTAVCEGNTTTLTANGAASYQWSNGTSGANVSVGTFGIYTVTGTSAEGCSNTATTTVAVYSLPVINISGNTEICQGMSTTLTANGAATYMWNNGTTDAALTTSNAGTYTVIGTDANGCYNTETVTVEVNYPSNDEISVAECDSYEWQGTTYTESGDYTWTGQTIHGCDSVIILHLTVNESVTEEISETIEGSYEWNGTTYTESGDYTWTGQTVNGCDSTVTLHLTITTGIANYEGLPVKIWPNPAKSVINVECGIENAELQLFDATGRRVLTQESNGSATAMNVSTLAPGVYVLHIVLGNRTLNVSKIIKQ